MHRAHDAAAPTADRRTPTPRTPTPRTPTPRTPTPGAARLLALQRGAGNAATAVFVARQAVATAPAVRPQFQRGDTDRLVGVAQQKLNVLGASPQLAIDGEFGARTEAATRRFQRDQALARSGRLDATTWLHLDTSAPGGDIGPDGELSPVLSHVLADPTMPTPEGMATHPELRLGATGPAVAELREKLNTANAAGLAVSAGLGGADAAVFDAATEQAVRDFQRANRPLRIDGIVGVRTWRCLDRLAPGAGAGRIERLGTERARGMDFGGAIEADWALEPDRTAPSRLVVRVRYEFVNDPASPVDKPAEVSRIFDGIRDVWSRFRAQEVPLQAGVPPRPPVPVDFEPVEGTPTRHHVTLTAGVGPTNSGQYFINPSTDLRLVAAHEFGHHIGLQDEYQQTAADHMRQTGQAALVGEVTGDADPRDIAVELGRAVRSSPRAERGPQALAVIEGHALTQGAFAQQVAQRYHRFWGVNVVDDCNNRIDSWPEEGSMSMLRRCTQPFGYNTDNLMAGAEAEAAGSPHIHDIAPRHIREYTGIVERALGGVWESAPR
jgi:peptidoglycan hydrolase-like protein with peptidoglycan-binding domain